jgi:hypothetical protein
VRPVLFLTQLYSSAKILHESSLSAVRDVCETALIHEHIAMIKAELTVRCLRAAL